MGIGLLWLLRRDGPHAQVTNVLAEVGAWGAPTTQSWFSDSDQNLCFLRIRVYLVIHDSE